MKKFLKIITGRMFATSIFILVQLLLLFAGVYWLSQYSIYFYGISVAISLILVIVIVGDESSVTFKLAWVIPMLILPVFGWLLYFVLERREVSKKSRNKYMKIAVDTKNILPQDEKLLDDIYKKDIGVAKQVGYIYNTSHSNIYSNTDARFFPTGEIFFETFLLDLRSAEKFIFIEYFIIEEGVMWNAVLEILEEKVKSGVDVRVMYDDLGTINLLPQNYDVKLRAKGIKTAIFNPFRPSIDAFMNYRDHRKITVIDGNIAYTGGINLSDEYINVKKRFGYWKDCAIRIRGDAVTRMSVTFLQLWNFANETIDTNYTKYFNTLKYKSDGYVQPFSDGPMNGHLTGEHSYINMINDAKKYVYITTPYLIIDSEMITALRLAVKCNVDVRIITPHIPDKWYVHAVTRSNYAMLVRYGVKIYEYTPGFIHAKSIIADDKVGIVGTINFDFRSFYLHFENGIFMYNSRAIMEVKQDYENMLPQCKRITPEMCNENRGIKKFLCSFLKLFSPLM